MALGRNDVLVKAAVSKTSKTTKNYNMQTTTTKTKKLRSLISFNRLPAALVAGLLLFAPCRLPAGEMNLGSPFTPAGANFSLTALQGGTPDASTITGSSTAGAQVSIGGELQTLGQPPQPTGFGVSVLGPNGQLNFNQQEGLGLYQPSGGNSVAADGLLITYTGPVTASSVTLTLADFDLNVHNITAGTTAAQGLMANNQPVSFLHDKVSPQILIQTAGGTVINVDPISNASSLILKSMEFASTQTNADTWTINIGTLLNGLGVNPNTAITSIDLTESKNAVFDNNNGQPQSLTTNSDPYFLIAAANGTVVPEPSSIALIIGAVVVGATYWVRRRLA